MVQPSISAPLSAIRGNEMKAATSNSRRNGTLDRRAANPRMNALSQVPQFQQSRGFSLLEMMVVIVIVSIVIGAVLTQVEQTQRRAATEQGTLDQFQDAQNFVDQIATDIHQMGYPNIHSFDITTWATPYVNNNQIAAGLVSLSPTQIIFEGDMDGSGNVSIVSYAVNGDGKCAKCLERAEIQYKPTGITAASNAAYVTAIKALLTTGTYSAEIQNVQNTASIFKAYDSSGNALASSFDMGTNAATTAQARAIQISLDVSDPTKVDPKTRQSLEANITSRAQIVNCSMAGSAATLGITQVGGGIQLLCQP